MRVPENKHLVKHLRKLVKEYGFKDALRGLAEIAGKHKRSKARAAWGFIAYELRDIADDEVPE